MPGSWTLESIPDLTGRTVVVTGANSGIGFAVARELARRGATTLLACRSAARGQAAAASIRAGIPGATLRVHSLDLAHLASVHRFADDVRRTYDRLDLLINNAGVMFSPRATTIDGLERTIGVNHLGHFALTGRLIELLQSTPDARIVTVTSLAHARGRLDTSTWLGPRPRGYGAARAYADSKLANLLFALELDRRLDGATPRSLAAHPGGAPTGLGRRMEDHRMYRVIRPLMECVSQTVLAAASPILRAATDPCARGGQYLGPSGRLGFRGPPIPVSPSRRATDLRAGKLLWGVSTRLTRVEVPLE
ncbi:MAG TPA: SDR family NAD(P)-dependent oxidoreductase [Candidatus Acetothermia bacterium]|nr:SDR family NAD(P)-dependent oxidoreductase [Candidatus Acetothermia bacterium]